MSTEVVGEIEGRPSVSASGSGGVRAVVVVMVVIGAKAEWIWWCRDGEVLIALKAKFR